MFQVHFFSIFYMMFVYQANYKVKVSGTSTLLSITTPSLETVSNTFTSDLLPSTITKGGFNYITPEIMSNTFTRLVSVYQTKITINTIRLGTNSMLTQHVTVLSPLMTTKLRESKLNSKSLSSSMLPKLSISVNVSIFGKPTPSPSLSFSNTISKLSIPSIVISNGIESSASNKFNTETTRLSPTTKDLLASTIDKRLSTIGFKSNERDSSLIKSVSKVTILTTIPTKPQFGSQTVIPQSLYKFSTTALSMKPSLSSFASSVSYQTMFPSYILSQDANTRWTASFQASDSVASKITAAYSLANIKTTKVPLTYVKSSFSTVTSTTSILLNTPSLSTITMQSKKLNISSVESNVTKTIFLTTKATKLPLYTTITKSILFNTPSLSIMTLQSKSSNISSVKSNITKTIFLTTKATKHPLYTTITKSILFNTSSLSIMTLQSKKSNISSVKSNVTKTIFLTTNATKHPLYTTITKSIIFNTPSLSIMTLHSKKSNISSVKPSVTTEMEGLVNKTIYLTTNATKLASHSTVIKNEYISATRSLSSVIVISSSKNTALPATTTVPIANGTETVFIVIRVPTSISIQTESFKTNLSSSLSTLYKSAENLQNRKRRSVTTQNAGTNVVITSLSRRQTSNGIVDVKFNVVKNDSSIVPANEVVAVYQRLTYSEMDKQIGYIVIYKPAVVPVVKVAETTNIPLWVIIVAITAPIILILLLCNILCLLKYRASKKLKLAPITDNENKNDNSNEVPFKEYSMFKADARDLEYDIISPVYMDSSKSVSIQKDDFEVIPRRKNLKSKVEKKELSPQLEHVENEMLGFNSDSMNVLNGNDESKIKDAEQNDVQQEHALAGTFVNLTRGIQDFQVNPLDESTGVRFNLNIIPQNTPPSKVPKTLAPLRLSKLNTTSLQEGISMQDNNIPAIDDINRSEKNHVTFMDDDEAKEENNNTDITEQELIVMNEKKIIEKIRNKERMRNREKAKYARKMKKLDSNSDLANLAIEQDNNNSAVLSTGRHKYRKRMKKGNRKRITMNSVSPSISVITSDNETDHQKKNHSKGSTESRRRNTHDVDESHHFYASALNTNYYPLAPAFPMAAHTYYDQSFDQPSYRDLFQPPLFEDAVRPTPTLNSTMSQHLASSDKKLFPSPLILPNGRCQPRNSIRLVAENELELLERAQLKARKKMKFILDKSVNENSSINVSVAEC